MYILSKGLLEIQLCAPGEYYLGTRFDRSGIFRRIELGDYVFADEWFQTYNPLAHDAVCGPSEEFVTVDFEGIETGDSFVKVGVGLLKRPDDNPYDWFRLYDIEEPGKWDIDDHTDHIVYRHQLEGWYIYVKEIKIESERTLSISHTLKWQHPQTLKGHTYNHNFFTFNNTPVGSERTIDFPFTPTGNWRMKYDNVALVKNGIRFIAPITKTPSVYMGNLHDSNNKLTDYQSVISEKERSITIQGSEPLSHYVFWSNPQVACVEPYMPLKLHQGESKHWKIIYTFK